MEEFNDERFIEWFQEIRKLQEYLDEDSNEEQGTVLLAHFRAL